MRLDLGESIRYARPVASLVGERLALSLALVLLGLGGPSSSPCPWPCGRRAFPRWTWP